MIAKLIAMGHFYTVQLLGLEPLLIIIPFTKKQQAWLWHSDTMWQKALSKLTGQFGEHLPSPKILNFASQYAFIFPHNIQEDPMTQALVIFSDASGSGNAAYFFLSRTKSCTNRFFHCSVC
jgi:hypothetical protein